MTDVAYHLGITWDQKESPRRRAPHPEVGVGCCPERGPRTRDTGASAVAPSMVECRGCRRPHLKPRLVAIEKDRVADVPKMGPVQAGWS